MFQQANPNEMPGVGESLLNLNRAVWLGRQGVQYNPGGGRIDGTLARDLSNTAGQWEANGAALPPNMAAVAGTFSNTLQAGLLMGVVTASGKYRNSIIGAIGTAITAGTTTTITVPAAVAAEVARLITQAAGNVSLNLIGPPTASGTVATTAVTAVSATGTTITISSEALPACTADSFLCPNDGSQTPVSFIDEIDGIRVTDIYGNGIAVQYPRVPIAGGVVNVANIPNYPTSASLITWLKTQLNTKGSFRFSDDFGN